MDAYIYRAALHCEKCAKKIMTRLAHKAPVDPTDEHSWDSDDYPKGPYRDGGGEADCPQHCDTCGVFLENRLTDYGFDCFMEAIKENPKNKTVKTWKHFYSQIYNW